MGLHAFVHEHLPPAPARVLEVGCGRGDLARALARAGHRVVAIDPHAPDGDLFRTTTLEDFTDPEPFDAVVASLTLHHVADLARAFDKIAALLRPRGRLIVNEHAVDRLDEPTARWYLDKRTQARPDTSQSLERCLSEWSDDHADLHGYAAMRRELDRRFTERIFMWTPYLYGELGGVASEAEEQALIDAGAIQAMGFRYVGERSAMATTYMEFLAHAARDSAFRRRFSKRSEEMRGALEDIVAERTRPIAGALGMEPEQLAVVIDALGTAPRVSDPRSARWESFRRDHPYADDLPRSARNSRSPGDLISIRDMTDA